MPPEYMEPNWPTILIHESGHAVAALVLRGEVADMNLRCSVSNKPANRASYSLCDVEDGFVPNPRSPLERVMIYAAGAKAEEVLMGITPSEGFKSDQRKIEEVHDRLRRDADEGHLRSIGLPSDQLAACLEKIPEAMTKLAAVELEINSNYPQTRDLLNRHRKAVELIAETALQRIQEVDRIDGTILLTAEQVQLLWDESKSGN